MNLKIFRWPGCFLAFVFVLFFALNLRQLFDYDVWFQLIIGQETARIMAVPKAEFYLYTVLGEPSTFVGWLWGLLLYLAWLAGGYASVSLFNALVWGAMFVVAAAAILARVAHEATITAPYSRKALVLAALIATSVAYQYLVERAALRDEITVYLAWVVAIFLSVGISGDARRRRRFLIAVPLLSWALAWFHTTSVFMVLFLSGYLFQAVADAARQEGSTGCWRFIKRQSWPWLASMLAAVVLPCLNPNGVQQVLPLIAGLEGVLRAMFLGEQGKDPGQIVHRVLEYYKLVEMPEAWPAAILFFVSSAFVLWRDRSHRIANALFLTVGMLLSLLHVRALALWAVFLMIPLGVAIAPLLQKAMAVLESKGRGALSNALIVMCCFWTVGAVYNKEGGRWGIGYWPVPADEQLLKSLRAALPNGGRIFTWQPAGAYVRWHLGHNYLVAMDGHLTDGKSPAWKAYFDIEDLPDKGMELIEKWGVQAVYHPVLTFPQGYLHWLPFELINSEEWRLIAGDRNGLLFVRVKKGEVDEQTRNLLKIAYWRKVLVDALYVSAGSGERSNGEQVRKIVQYAQQKIVQTQSLMK